jgi:hypothetical protein
MKVQGRTFDATNVLPKVHEKMLLPINIAFSKLLRNVFGSNPGTRIAIA